MKITVFTGTRAEYGLLLPLLKRIDAAPDTDLSILVSGSHLSERHGHTIDAILADGFTVSAQVKLPLDDDSRTGVATAMGEALSGCAQALADIQPDTLVLLGDRYECLACATAAALLHIPVAHIHGGEVTEGAIDDYFRHAITKMAHLHFTSCEPYRRRVIQLGENPNTVFNVGALGVENILTMPLMDKSALESDLDFTMGDTCLLTTFHPVTLEGDGQAKLEAFFTGLANAMTANPTITTIVTGANADPGGSAIDARAAQLAQAFPERVLITPSLGLVRYLSAMKHCAAVLGNSSSGILEAPSFSVPTINVGTRQQGRIQARSILNCPTQAHAIAETIHKALSPSCREVVKQARNPYEKAGTSERILTVMKTTNALNIAKSFYDINHRLEDDKE
ncbi:UDP-N-acetylglucosamine 2-epimerase [Pseudodesulfovibrio sediminis]|uniref:UDP-N-acetyl glucosamine 2-epimerase n=1 Tax=Pseudodesulfovibrio sediminis TaxID=2810563 RepID=A0ABN6EQF5_9BACT|nr:UDP-N-acetylglucosamine 2-epimerase [Pseudodesulfovibrio sediminis]BCS87543.1 UDP-N-acetyl glucosamine 2-epimerase [Pseudodesulfovibrio sediminis]